MIGKASVFFGFLAIALLAYAAFRYVVITRSQAEKASLDSSSPRECPLRASEPEKDLGEQPCEDMRVWVRVQNTTGKPVRVVGLPPGCGQNCCMEAVCMDPFVLPGGGEREIECIAHAGKAGPFQCPVRIGYFDGDYQIFEINVRGTWTRPEDVLPKPSSRPLLHSTSTTEITAPSRRAFGRWAVPHYLGPAGRCPPCPMSNKTPCTSRV
jgi:hypothetical protein